MNKDFVDKLIAGNGWLSGKSEGFDDPSVICIVEYTNAWGALAYGVTFEGEDHDKYMRPSAYVQNPRIYWEKK